MILLREENILFKKGLVLGIIFLFIWMSIVPSTGIIVAEQSSISTLDGATLYVGGDGPGNYTKIQDAVDDADDGDTVFVYHGIYNKNDPYDQTLVSINKSIYLIGEDKNTTILNGSGKYGVVIVSKNGVYISGFTIQNSGGGAYPGSGIFISSKRDITLKNNIISNNPNCGIYCVDCNNCSFFNNIFLVNECAYYITSSLNCSIYRNLFIENSVGISIYEQGIFYIESNEFRDNGKGINIANGKGIQILSNNFIDNNIHATYVRQGFPLAFFEFIKNKQEWNSNFWDNWHITTPKPIFGKIRIWIVIGPLLWIPLYFPSFEFDYNPSQEPYNI